MLCKNCDFVSWYWLISSKRWLLLVSEIGLISDTMCFILNDKHMHFVGLYWAMFIHCVCFEGYRELCLTHLSLKSVSHVCLSEMFCMSSCHLTESMSCEQQSGVFLVLMWSFTLSPITAALCSKWCVQCIWWLAWFHPQTTFHLHLNTIFPVLTHHRRIYYSCYSISGVTISNLSHSLFYCCGLPTLYYSWTNTLTNA